MNRTLTIGSISASIAGDSRYTDQCNVYYAQETGEVFVVVTSSTPRGGMDGDPTPFVNTQTKVCLPAGCKAKEVLDAVKRVMQDDSYNFKRYGAPTKNFAWLSNSDGFKNQVASKFNKGMSVAKVADALGAVRS